MGPIQESRRISPALKFVTFMTHAKGNEPIKLLTELSPRFQVLGYGHLWAGVEVADRRGAVILPTTEELPSPGFGEDEMRPRLEECLGLTAELRTSFQFLPTLVFRAPASVLDHFPWVPNCSL